MTKHFNTVWIFSDLSDLGEFIALWKDGKNEDLPGYQVDLKKEFDDREIISKWEECKSEVPVIALECWHGSMINITPLSLEIYEIEPETRSLCLLDKMFYLNKEDFMKSKES